MLARASVLAHRRVAGELMQQGEAGRLMFYIITCDNIVDRLCAAGPEILVTACSRFSSQASSADAAAVPAPCDRDASCDASSSSRSSLASNTVGDC